MQYNRSKNAFESLAGENGTISKQQWLDDGPQSEQGQAWIENIWRVFSSNGKTMSVCFFFHAYFNARSFHILSSPLFN